jgi:cyclic pyranopterin monophosphate synthase
MKKTAAARRGRQSLGMVDTSRKPVSKRTAVAEATIKLSPAAFQEFITGGSPKGNVLETAKVAGIMAAKATPQIIPLCHPLELNKVNMTFEIDRPRFSITVQAEVNCWGRTGVEMEALTAVSAAALTIYDMMKWADKSMVIGEIKLLAKSGGQSGAYLRK